MTRKLHLGRSAVLKNHLIIFAFAIDPVDKSGEGWALENAKILDKEPIPISLGAVARKKSSAEYALQQFNTTNPYLKMPHKHKRRERDDSYVRIHPDLPDPASKLTLPTPCPAISTSPHRWSQKHSQSANSNPNPSPERSHSHSRKPKEKPPRRVRRPSPRMPRTTTLRRLSSG